ncbi:MAG: hypothetical protein K8T20_04155 [Planctomycetes bacterium]|nr:hypothetical protein [Planctomycetota bacterium]
MDPSADAMDELPPMTEAPEKEAAEPKAKSRPPAPEPAPAADPGASPASDATPSGGVPSLARSKERLGDMLVKSGAISADALEKALDTQRELRADTYIGEILVRESVIDENVLAQTISQQYRIPLIQLNGHEFKKDLLKLLTPEDAWRLRAIPTDKLGRILSVAMANPLDERATAELARITGLKIKPLIAVSSEMRQALDYLFPGRGPSSAPRTREAAAPAGRAPSVVPAAPAAGPKAEANTGRFLPRAIDSLHRAEAPPTGANTILRRAAHEQAAPKKTATSAPAGTVAAESVTEEAFEAATSTNPEHLLRAAPDASQRRRATPATPIGEAEFALFVGPLPNRKS